MKYKQNAKIQNLVNHIKGSELSKIAALRIPAVRFADEIGSKSEVAADAHANGVFHGLLLSEKFLKAKDRFIEGRYNRNRESGYDKVPASFAIYLATQETSEGDDYLYFIGTPDQIIKKLEKVIDKA